MNYFVLLDYINWSALASWCWPGLLVAIVLAYIQWYSGNPITVRTLFAACLLTLVGPISVILALGLFIVVCADTAVIPGRKG
jgi:hypothetical protein